MIVHHHLDRAYVILLHLIMQHLMVDTCLPVILLNQMVCHIWYYLNLLRQLVEGNGCAAANKTDLHDYVRLVDAQIPKRPRQFFGTASDDEGDSD